MLGWRAISSPCLGSRSIEKLGALLTIAGESRQARARTSKFPLSALLALPVPLDSSPSPFFLSGWLCLPQPLRVPGTHSWMFHPVALLVSSILYGHSRLDWWAEYKRGRSRGEKEKKESRVLPHE